MIIKDTSFKQWFKENQSRAIKLLQALVQENSTRMNECSSQAIIIEKCRQLGLALDIWEIGEENLFRHPAYNCDRKDFEGTPNVVAVLKGTGGGKSIILNGYIDVETVEDACRWTYAPFSGHVESGKIYGRGSTDMKGGLVAFLLAIEALLAMEIRLKGDIIFQSVIEEQGGGAGTLAAIVRGYIADIALIPRPTNMKVLLKQPEWNIEQHPFVGILSDSYSQIVNQKPTIEAGPLGMGGNILENIGGIPVVTFGPGVSLLENNVNEFIDFNDLFIASEIIALSLMRWCEIA